MDDLESTIERIRSAADAMGIEASTICRNATGNPRLWDRLQKRAERNRADIKRLSDWLQANEPAKQAAQTQTSEAA